MDRIEWFFLKLMLRTQYATVLNYLACSIQSTTDLSLARDHSRMMRDLTS